MKIEPESYDSMCCSDSPMYPYGTRIELNGEAADGVGYDKLKAGDKVEVRCIAFVKEKEERADGSDDKTEGESDHQICFQITDINVKKTAVDTVKELYGK